MERERGRERRERRERGERERRDRERNVAGFFFI